MLRKQEKNAITRGVLLGIGWGWGLDRFYEGDKKGGIFSIIGWAIIFTSFTGLLLIIMLNNFSIQEKVAIEKNINIESLVKAEVVDSLKNNNFPIKQVKSGK